MRIEPVTIRFKDHWTQEVVAVQVEGLVFDDYPGLAITPHMYSTIDGKWLPDGWAITHTKSGIAILVSLRSRTAARKVMRSLPAGIDWTLRPKKLLTQDTYQKMRTWKRSVDVYEVTLRPEAAWG